MTQLLLDLSTPTLTPPPFVPQPTEDVEHLIYMALQDEWPLDALNTVLECYKPTEALSLVESFTCPTVQHGCPNWGALIVAEAQLREAVAV